MDALCQHRARNSVEMTVLETDPLWGPYESEEFFLCLLEERLGGVGVGPLLKEEGVGSSGFGGF